MTSVTKFLGTRISITSRKSLIRYEGTFYAIDRIKKTVYIIDVDMKGTEDRDPVDPTPENKDLKYEYIIFYFSDILDIHGLEHVEEICIFTGGSDQSTGGATAKEPAAGAIPVFDLTCAGPKFGKGQTKNARGPGIVVPENMRWEDTLGLLSIAASQLQLKPSEEEVKEPVPEEPKAETKSQKRRRRRKNQLAKQCPLE